MRESPFVPVLLGDSIPRGDRSPAEQEQWCKAMKILFTPWRIPDDLKSQGETWFELFANTTFSENAKLIIRNMNVENGCKDAHDKYSKRRKAGELNSPLLDSFCTGGVMADLNSLDNAVMNDSRLDREDDQDENKEIEMIASREEGSRNRQADKLIGVASRTSLFEFQAGNNVENIDAINEIASVV